MQFTILGSKGFIGSHLIKKLNDNGITHNSIDKIESYKRNFGNVIYSIGLTADFRERPFDTVEAHVCELHKFLKNAKFDSFLYLSSTRIYSMNTQEEMPLTVTPSNFSDLYNISKIMGEALCFATNKPNIRIARLSNVIGNNFTSSDFLTTLIRDAIQKKSITLYTSLQSEKDYIFVEDVVDLLLKIALYGKHRVYNIASGTNTKTETIVNEISRLTHCKIFTENNVPTFSFPLINIDKIKNEFKYHPSNIIDKLELIVNQFMENFSNDKKF